MEFGQLIVRKSLKLRFLGTKYAKNAFAPRASPQTPLGELTALPRPLAGF